MCCFEMRLVLPPHAWVGNECLNELSKAVAFVVRCRCDEVLDEFPGSFRPLSSVVLRMFGSEAVFLPGGAIDDLQL